MNVSKVFNSIPLPVAIWSAAIVAPFLNLGLSLFIESRKARISSDSKRKETRHARNDKKEAIALEGIYSRVLKFHSAVDDMFKNKNELELSDHQTTIYTCIRETFEFLNQNSIYIHMNLYIQANQYALDAHSCVLTILQQKVNDENILVEFSMEQQVFFTDTTSPKKTRLLLMLKRYMGIKHHTEF